MKQYFTIDRAVHVVIVLCACTSLENVKDFFLSKGHPVGASWLISITLGLGVVTTSVMLTQVDHSKDRAVFIWLLSSVSSFALISGAIQAAQYAAHGVHAPWNMLLGFALPLAGEILLAWAASAYHQYQRRMLLSTIENSSRESVMRAIQSGLDQIKLTDIQGTINDLVSSLASQSLKQAASSLLTTTPVGLLPQAAVSEWTSKPDGLWEVPIDVLENQKDFQDHVNKAIGTLIRIPRASAQDDLTSAQDDLTSAQDDRVLDPQKHVLIAKKSREIYSITSIEGDRIEISLTTDSRYRRTISLSKLDRFYEVSNL
jgi:hypothetical protein